MAVSAWVYIVDYFYIKVVRIDLQTEQSYDLKAHALVFGYKHMHAPLSAVRLYVRGNRVISNHLV